MDLILLGLSHHASDHLDVHVQNHNHLFLWLHAISDTSKLSYKVLIHQHSSQLPDLMKNIDRKKIYHYWSSFTSRSPVSRRFDIMSKIYDVQSVCCLSSFPSSIFHHHSCTVCFYFNLQHIPSFTWILVDKVQVAGTSRYITTFSHNVWIRTWRCITSL